MRFTSFVIPWSYHAVQNIYEQTNKTTTALTRTELQIAGGGGGEGGNKILVHTLNNLKD